MASTAIHPLQIEIFERLRTNPQGLRFSQMCPKGIESDIDNYHLKYLVKSGFIKKSDGKYLMTAKGKEHVVDLAPLRFGVAPMLKIAAMNMALKTTDEGLKILYQRRLREPHFGSIVMVAGGLKRGETLLAAAKRRLLEEAGLVCEPRWIGTLRKIRLRTEDRRPWSDITYHICASFEPAGEILATKFGEHFWLSLPEAARLEISQSVGSPFLSELLLELDKDLSKLDNGFYKEEVVVSDIW